MIVLTQLDMNYIVFTLKLSTFILFSFSRSIIEWNLVFNASTIVDNITQWVIWGSIFSLITGKKSNKSMLLWAAITNIPDLDVFISRLVTNNVIDQFFFHRGIMHSIIFNVAVSLILWWLLHQRDSSTPYRKYTIWCLLSILCGHLLIDGMTNYGMRYFLPRDKTVYSTDNIFVIDFGARIITIGGLVRYLISTAKSRVAKYILVIIWCYFFLTLGIRQYVQQQFTKQYPIQLQTSQIIKSLTIPEPLQIALRRHVIKTDQAIYEGYYSLFDSNTDAITRKTSLVDEKSEKIVEALSHEQSEFGRRVQQVLSFTRGIYLIYWSWSWYRIENFIFSPVNGRQTWATRMFGFEIIKTVDWYDIRNSQTSWSSGRITKQIRDAFWERVRSRS